jgi:hypothetical protein
MSLMGALSGVPRFLPQPSSPAQSPGLPSQAQGYDLHRMVLAYFAVAGRDLLGAPPPPAERDALVTAVYAAQACAPLLPMDWGRGN